MKAAVKRLIGADRRPIIAVIGRTREEVELCAAHASTGGSGLPIWAWCTESCDTAGAETTGEAIAGCERLRVGASAADIRRDFGSVWPALIVVAWTGWGGNAWVKLLPLITPPFRVVICNEANGFFAAKPGPLAAHALRRLRDGSVSAGRRAADWSRGSAMVLWGLTVALWKGIFQVADKSWSLFLAVLGFLAKCTPPLAHAVMGRLGEGHLSHQITPEPCGARYTEIMIPGRAWPRQEVLAAVTSSSAHFIVFRRLGEQESPEPLIEIARSCGAFAVGRQMAYAGWRKVILARHPFRKLQPGEVTQVIAPWSPLLVIRRDVMLQFGVPHAATLGAALLVLYWNAAAAGLRSWVVGRDLGQPADQSAVITQEPAMELEDVEFTLRLALSRKLRHLAVANPHSVRGNVATSPEHRKNFRRGLPRVLVVSPYLPYPLSHGGAVRMYNLCRAMSGDVDFILACFREANEHVSYPELHEVFREVYAVDIDEKYPDAFAPRQVVEYRNSAMAELIRMKCLSGEVDVVQLEYTQMAEYGDHTGAVPVVLVEHDLTFTLHEQLAEKLGTVAARQQYELWRGFERSALQCSNAVWTMSDRDRVIAIEHGAPRRSTRVVPNGVDLQRFQPQRRETSGPSLLFVGSFRHLPNLLAFEALRETIMPQVWRALPAATLNVIAGPHYERAAEAAKKRELLAPEARINIQGFVEDVRPAYRECDVAVIPLPVSAGTNIKLMEAMACGRAVVSTELGCQGLGLLDGADLLVREVSEGFAEAVIQLLTDDTLRARIAATARQTADRRFGWDYIASGALETYSDLTSQVQELAVGD